MREDGSPPFFTIGHSNRSLEAFAGLLREARVELLVDIRKIPMSRANPQFNAHALPAALEPFQISYEHIAALGGLRGKAPALPADINGFWENKSFHNYTDYALSPPFRLGLERLIEAGRQRRSAIMCSEAVWWRCHRRIVADYLIADGQTVFHIMGPDRIEPARLTAGAVVQPDRTIRYPAPLDC
ncbi:DUF488 family protein [Phenylobacterium sp.]|uniref:DUF488 domain-containing protein n=1 Tax=Phenylobacterium sp. TaxID=1871053 RepID=UPI0035B25638